MGKLDDFLNAQDEAAARNQKLLSGGQPPPFQVIPTAPTAPSGGELLPNRPMPVSNPADMLAGVRPESLPENQPHTAAPATPPGIVYQTPGAGAAQPVIQPQVVPAHEVALVNPERQKAKIEAIGDVAQSLEGEKEAEDEVAKARGLAAEMRATGQRGVAKKFEEGAEDVEQRAVANRAANADFLDRIDAFSNDLANDKIGVQQSVPKQVTWGLARVFGAIQQGLQHLPTNQVADGIDKQIQQEIENQKANHAIKRGRLEDLKTLYGYAREQTKDDDEAHRLARAYGLEAAKAEANALGEAAGTPLAMAEAKKIQAALSEKQALLGEHAVDAGISMNKWVPAGLTGGGASHVDSKNVFFDPITKQYYAAADGDSRKQLVKASELVQRIDAAAEAYQNALREINFGSKVFGKAGLDSAAMSRAKAAHIALLTDIREANQEGGVIREGLMKSGIYEESVVSPDRFTGDAAQQIGVIRDRVKNLHNNVFATEAPIPVIRAPQPIGQQPKNVPLGQSYEPQQKVSGAAVGFTGVGAKAKGGKTDEGEPYLVGEKGPELVLPDDDGWVMTAQQTAALAGAPPTKQQIEARPELAALAPDHQRALGGMMAPGDFDSGNGVVLNRMGGMDPGASAQAMSNISTQYMRQGGAGGPGPAGFARAEGGPVMSTVPASMPPAGPNMSVPPPPPPVNPEVDAIMAQRRANGLGAGVDMSPIAQAPQPVPGQLGQALEAERATANPYAPQPRNVQEDNRDEAASIRASFGQDKNGEELPREFNPEYGSVGDRASAVARGKHPAETPREAQKKPNFLQVLGQILSGRQQQQPQYTMVPVQQTREDGGEIIADALGHLLPDTKAMNMAELQHGEPRGAATAGAKADTTVRGKAPTAVEKFAAKAGVQKRAGGGPVDRGGTEDEEEPPPSNRRREDGGPVGPDGTPYTAADEKDAVQRFFAQNLARKRAETVGATMDQHVRGKAPPAREEGGPVIHSSDSWAHVLPHSVRQALSMEPKPAAPQPQPRAAETHGAKALVDTSNGHNPTTATLVHPGPVEYPEKVTLARAYGGSIRPRRG